VSAVEKSKICLGTINEDTIKESVLKVKEQWSKVVKLSKHNKGEFETDDIRNSKRLLESLQNTQAVKKTKTDFNESFSLSNLLNKKLFHESVKISNNTTSFTEYKKPNTTIVAENIAFAGSVALDVNHNSDEVIKKDKRIK